MYVFTTRQWDLWYLRSLLDWDKLLRDHSEHVNHSTLDIGTAESPRRIDPSGGFGADEWLMVVFNQAHVHVKSRLGRVLHRYNML